MGKTLTLEECAELLKINRSTALELAGQGVIPGAKIGRAWVFVEDDVLDYLRREVSRQVESRRPKSSSQLWQPLATLGDSDGRRRRKPLPVLPKLPKESGE